MAVAYARNANVALQHGTTPETSDVAEAIVAARQREVAAMRAWLMKNRRWAVRRNSP